MRKSEFFFILSLEKSDGIMIRKDKICFDVIYTVKFDKFYANIYIYIIKYILVIRSQIKNS